MMTPRARITSRSPTAAEPQRRHPGDSDQLCHPVRVTGGRPVPWAGAIGGGLLLQRHIDHVLRTALVKPAMNKAANAQASSRNTQPTADSHAAVTLAESVV